MSGSEEFVGRTEAFVARHDLLRAGQTVLVGVSGGADSVALAAVLRSLGRYALRIAHVHHGLRADAEADAEFVADLAEKWDLPFCLERIDVPGLAKTWRVGVEEAARRGRYEALSAIATRAGAKLLAVGHHADDQVETILHRILRGTHLRGLAGMLPGRPLGGGISLVRPLLWARRAQIEAFCRSAGLTWRTDHTNQQTDFTRNFIRHELLPLVRERLNVRADEAVLRLGAAARQAEATLAELAAGLVERACRKRSGDKLVLRVGPLRKAPRPLAAVALRTALESLSAPQQELSAERFEDLLAVLAGEVPAVDLPGGFRAECDGRCISLSGPAVEGRGD